MKNGINLWLDDVRDPAVHSPHYEWVWVKTAQAAIADFCCTRSFIGTLVSKEAPVTLSVESTP